MITTTSDLSKLPSVSLANKSYLPKKPAIYFVCDGQKVLYIGKAVDVWQRWQGHHRYQQLNKSYKNARIFWMSVDAITLLTEIETALINQFNPLLNGTKAPHPLGRKRTNFVLDDRVLAALKKMAKRSNTSVNRFVENVLFELAKENGEIETSAEPLGETRGRPTEESTDHQ